MEKNLKAIHKELEDALENISTQQMDHLAELIHHAKKIFVAGRGRTGLMASAFAMRLMQLGLDAHVVGEVTAPPISEGDLFLICSGSGSTTSLVALAEKAKSVGANLFIVTANEACPIKKMGAEALLIRTSTPKAQVKANLSIQPMAALFEQSIMIVLDAIVLKLQDSIGETSDMMFERHANLE